MGRFTFARRDVEALLKDTFQQKKNLVRGKETSSHYLLLVRDLGIYLMSAGVKPMAEHRAEYVAYGNTVFCGFSSEANPVTCPLSGSELHNALSEQFGAGDCFTLYIPAAPLIKHIASGPADWDRLVVTFGPLFDAFGSQKEQHDYTIETYKLQVEVADE
jgi:hypothetical protein